jgi:transcriptional regulator NrdR family protein
MWCPQCAKKTKVISTVTGIQNERFRKCLSCHFIFSTVEAIKNSRYWKEYAKKIQKTT